jgi:hypothetical protein
VSMSNPHGDPREARTTLDPTYALRVPLRPTTDAYITCVVCDQDHVDFEFSSRTPRRRQFQGLHKRCAETIGEVTELRSQAQSERAITEALTKPKEDRV